MSRILEYGDSPDTAAFNAINPPHFVRESGKRYRHLPFLLCLAHYRGLAREQQQHYGECVRSCGSSYRDCDRCSA